MLTLENDRLRFNFPRVHQQAQCQIRLQRTLRLSGAGLACLRRESLGEHPLRLVDDYSRRLPRDWGFHGGIFVPLHQSEALTLSFQGNYPCAVKVILGSMNALTGLPRKMGLSQEPQDYLETSSQQWLDRPHPGIDGPDQFISMPLDKGSRRTIHFPEGAEQLALQLQVFPMKPEVFRTHFQQSPDWDWGKFGRQAGADGVLVQGFHSPLTPESRPWLMPDLFGVDAWDIRRGGRCLVHLLNSTQYLMVTGERVRRPGFDMEDYAMAGLPWFDHYADQPRTKINPIQAPVDSLIGDDLVVVENRILTDTAAYHRIS